MEHFRLFVRKFDVNNKYICIIINFLPNIPCDYASSIVFWMSGKHCLHCELLATFSLFHSDQFIHTANYNSFLFFRSLLWFAIRRRWKHRHFVIRVFRHAYVELTHIDVEPSIHFCIQSTFNTKITSSFVCKPNFPVIETFIWAENSKITERISDFKWKYTFSGLNQTYWKVK